METLTFTVGCQTLQRVIEPADVSVLNWAGGAAGPDGSSDREEQTRCSPIGWAQSDQSELLHPVTMKEP